MQLTTELIVSLLFRNNFIQLCQTNGVDPADLTDPRVAQLAQLTTVLIAACCLGMGLLRFGFFESILAHSVLAGTSYTVINFSFNDCSMPRRVLVTHSHENFLHASTFHAGLINALIVQIIIGQLPQIFGMAAAPAGSNTFETFHYVISQVWSKANPLVILISAVTMTFVISINLAKKRWPDNRLLKYFPTMGAAILIGTLVSWLARFDQLKPKVALLGYFSSLCVNSIMCCISL
jgi:MFS superfamily sulfate permease-like transporter